MIMIFPQVGILYFGCFFFSRIIVYNKPMSKPGVYETTKKDGTVYFRTSITRKGKHISLGSFADEATAYRAYLEACALLDDPSIQIIDYSDEHALSFDKWVSIINFRDNRMYISNPIYILKKMFNYYISPTEILKFDADELFYYSSHKIMKRGSHYFVADYGLQLNIRNRYGIRSYAVEGRDYIFLNGDILDFRSANLQVNNRFIGVTKEIHKGKTVYRARIHIKGNYIIGDYPDEVTAAIAYNKAADILNIRGVKKNYARNDIADISESDYWLIYKDVKISKAVRTYLME